MTAIWHLCPPETQVKLRLLLPRNWTPPAEDGVSVKADLDTDQEELRLIAIGKTMAQAKVRD
ncbi:MAG: hypothetical protein P3T54_00130 [Dehalogenimonas sp.]|nr:hypothetical protein [Dehalogenimonas sp.]